MQALFQIILKKCRTKVLLNVLWLFLDRIFRMSLSLGTSVLVIRYLDVTQFGLLSFATAFVSLFAPFSTLGISSLVVRNIAIDPKKKYEILGTAFWLQIFGGLLTIALAAIAVFALPQSNSTVVRLVLILSCSGIFQSFRVIDFWFQSQVKSKNSVIARNIAFLVTVLSKVVLVACKAPLSAFALITVAEAILSSLCLIVSYRMKEASLRLWKWNKTLAKKLAFEGRPLILSGLAVVLFMRIDQIMLREMVGDQAVGLYSVAVKVSELWYFFPTAITTSVASSIYAYAEHEDKVLYYKRISQLLRVLAFISIIVALPMTFLSESLVTLLFGESYAAAGSILSIHIWAALFVFTGTGTSSWFIAEGLTYLALRKKLLGAIVNIGLNFLLIPIYSGKGAAIATVISYSASSLFSNALDKRSRKLFYIQLKSFLLIP